MIIRYNNNNSGNLIRLQINRLNNINNINENIAEATYSVLKMNNK